MFISGITRHSGKTTSLEAFVSRVGMRALVFRCGRGEIGFDKARPTKPFFRERTDWRFVEGMLSAHLREKVKFYRGDIMRACRGARTLRDVHANVRTALGKAKEGSFVQKIYTELDQYFAEALPELERIDFADVLVLGDGVNVVDLEGVPTATQQLVIAACIDRIMDSMTGVILVVPEAWEMVPQDRASPVKLAAEAMVRKGAKIGNYLWLDSQQMTGMEMDILRNVDVWMFGRQTLDLEKERVAKQIPGRKVKPDDVHALTVGQFYVVQYGERVQKVYVRPAWLPHDTAVAVARGKLSAAKAAADYRPAERKREVIELTNEERKRYEEIIQGLKVQLEEAHADRKGLRQELEEFREQSKAQHKIITELKAKPDRLPIIQAPPEAGGPSESSSVGSEVDLETLAIKVADMISKGDISIQALERNVTVTKVADPREFSTSTVKGKILYVLVHDLKNEGSEADISNEMAERGWNYGHSTMAPELAKLVKNGDLVQSGERPARYHIPGKIHLTVKEAEA